MSHAADATTLQDRRLQVLVTQTIRPMMKQYGISGMAVGLTIGGRHYIFDYGFASKAAKTPVDGKTLFDWFDHEDVHGEPRILCTT